MISLRLIIVGLIVLVLIAGGLTIRSAIRKHDAEIAQTVHDEYRLKALEQAAVDAAQEREFRAADEASRQLETQAYRDTIRGNDSRTAEERARLAKLPDAPLSPTMRAAIDAQDRLAREATR